MKILVTGANGFVGKNLLAQLDNIKNNKAQNYALTKDLEVLAYDVDTKPELLDVYASSC